ncbi:histidine kinase dimerization/phosphoacceptor domain -containing protein [Lutibacter oricola]|nr:histidine kinase dimerization/phosphoacceptor domain -containing protein [Lutibacter oricola]
MKKILLFLLVTISFVAHCQQAKIDSLKICLNEEKNTELEKLNLLKKLTELIHSNSKYKENFIYLKEFKNLSNKYNNDTLISKSNIYISEYYILKEDHKTAENIVKKTLKKQDSIKYPDNHYHLLNQLARITHAQGNFLGAKDIYEKAISKYEKNPTTLIIYFLYNNLSETYRQLGKKKLSEEAVLKSIEYAEKFDEINLVISSNTQLGWHLMELKEYEKADKYFLSSFNLNKIHNYENLGYSYRNLALNYSRWGKYGKAITHNEIALKFLQEIGDKRFSFDVMNSLAVTYNRMGNGRKGVDYGKKTLDLALELNHPIAIRVSKHTLAVAYKENKDYRESLELFNEIAKDTVVSSYSNNIDFRVSLLSNLSDIYLAQKNYKKSLITFKRFTVLKDSMEAKQKENRITEFETKYQTQKKEKENVQLKADNAEQALLTQKANTRNLLLAIGLLSVICIAFFIWKRYKSEAKAKQTISSQKNVIEELQKELHHRVKNNLNIIDAFVDEIKDDYQDSALEDKLEELQNRIASINEVHSQLYQSTDVTNVNLKKYIESLANNVASTYSNKNISVKQQINEDLKLQADKSSVLGLIVNEFLTNSYKYAFENEGEIKVNMNETEDSYILKLADNGKGLPDDFDINTIGSYGLRIMKLLSRQLKGTFELKNKNGVRLNIQFPKA